MEPLRAVVREAWAATPRVRALRLAAPGGAPLPDWTAGAHVDVTIPGVGLRSYSLIETEPRDGPPLSYQLGVLRETASRGGSAYMHELARRRPRRDHAAGQSVPAGRDAGRNRAARRAASA